MHGERSCDSSRRGGVMIWYRAFKAEDYFLLDLPEDIGLEKWVSSKVSIKDVVEKAAAVAAGVTVFDGETPIFIFGLMPIGEIIGEVFLIPSSSFSRYIITAGRLLKEHLRMATAAWPRIQMTCLNKYRYRRFAEFLGFEAEGVLRKYDKYGRDYLIMSIVS